MHLQINSTDLLGVLGRLQSVVEKRNVKTILSNVKISTKKNSIALYTTDLDIFVKEVLPAKIGGALSTTVSIQVLYDIVKNFQDGTEINMTFEPSDNPIKVVIKAGHATFSLPCISSEEFPDFEDGAYSAEFNIAAEDLLCLLNTTKHAMSSDDTRYYLNGIFFHSLSHQGGKILRCVATDVHRMALTEISQPDDFASFPEVILPKKTVNQLTKLLDNSKSSIKFSISSSKVKVVFNELTVISKLIDAKFPDYQGVVPLKNSKVLITKVADLIKAITMATAISTERVIEIKLVLAKDKLILSVNDKNSSTGNVEVNANYDHEPMEMAFNSRYLLDILNNIDSSDVIMKFESSNNAVLMESTDNDTAQFVLMPMKL